jgi:hypothetical protein
MFERSLAGGYSNARLWQDYKQSAHMMHVTMKPTVRARDLSGGYV